MIAEDATEYRAMVVRVDTPDQEASGWMAKLCYSDMEKVSMIA